MDQLKSAEKIIEVSSLTLSFALQQNIIDWLQKSALVKDKNLSFLISIILIIGLFILIELLFKKIINIPLIRKQILNGDFIEGQWAEISYDSTTNEGLAFSLLTIRGKEDKLTLDGDSFDINSHAHVGSFSSNSINYTYPHLYYNYKYDINNQMDVKEGIARIKFISRGNKEPLMHTGFFVDLETKKKINFISWKITDKDLLKKLDNPENFSQILIDFINKMKLKNALPKLPKA